MCIQLYIIHSLYTWKGKEPFDVVFIHILFFIRRTLCGATNIHNMHVHVSVSYRPEPTTPNRSAHVHVSVDGDHRTSPGHSISHTYSSRQSDHHSEESASTHYECVCVCVCMCKVQLA